MKWGPWSSCSVTCSGGGIKIRSRKCGGDFPDSCDPDGFTDSESCSVDQECPRWSVWTVWSRCSTTCDIGTRKRFQTCSAATVESCDDDNRNSTNITYTFNKEAGKFIKEDIENCSEGQCSYWENWRSWSDCSSTCNSGFQIRTRSCFGDFPKSCYAEGDSIQRRECNDGSCGVWSNWFTWSQCSKTCGKIFWLVVRVNGRGVALHILFSNRQTCCLRGLKYSLPPQQRGAPGPTLSQTVYTIDPATGRFQEYHRPMAYISGSIETAFGAKPYSRFLVTLKIRFFNRPTLYTAEPRRGIDLCVNLCHNETCITHDEAR